VAIAIVISLFVTFWPYQRRIPGETDIITVAFSADGKKLLGGTRGGEAYLWNVDTGQMFASGYSRKSSKENVPTPFNALALAPNGEFFVDAGSALSLIALDSSKNAPVIWEPDFAYGGAAVSPDGSRISAISSQERLLIWKLGSSNEPRDMGRADAGVYGATAFSPDGGRIVTAGHLLRMIDVESGRELWARPRDNFVFLTVAFRADGEVVATGSQDTSIRLWDAESGKEIAILRGTRAMLTSWHSVPTGKKWLPGDATDSFYYGICLLPRPPIDSWQKQREARLSVLMDGGSPPGERRRSLRAGKQAREQKPANFQQTILLFAPLAALQTKGLRPYAEVSWRLRIADD